MSPRPTLSERAAGLLLHPTSLPGGFGNGDLGDSAQRFVDFLAAAGQRCVAERREGSLASQPPSTVKTGRFS